MTIGHIRPSLPLDVSVNEHKDVDDYKETPLQACDGINTATATGLFSLIHTWTLSKKTICLLRHQKKLQVEVLFDKKTIRIVPLPIPTNTSVDQYANGLKEMHPIIFANGNIKFLDCFHIWTLTTESNIKLLGNWPDVLSNTGTLTCVVTCNAEKIKIFDIPNSKVDAIQFIKSLKRKNLNPVIPFLNTQKSPDLEFLIKEKLELDSIPVLNNFPAINGYAISVLEMGGQLVWQIVNEMTSKITRFPVNFSNHFPRETQINYIKQLLATEVLLARSGNPKPTDNEQFIVFEYKNLKSPLKNYFTAILPCQHQEMVEIDHAQREVLWEFSDSWQDNFFGDVCLFRTSNGIFWLINPVRCFGKPVYSFYLRDFGPNYYHFDFRGIMESLSLQDQLSFIRNFKTDELIENDEIPSIRLNKITAKSQLDPTKIIDSDVWGITLVSAGKSHAGHAMIAIEGLENGIPFKRYAHIGLRGESSTTGPGQIEIVKFKDNLQIQRQSATWLRNRSVVESMLEEVYSQAKETHAVSFNLLGDSLFTWIGSLFKAISDPFHSPIIRIAGTEPLDEDRFGNNTNCIMYDIRKLAKHCGIFFKRQSRPLLYMSPNDCLDPMQWTDVLKNLDGLEPPVEYTDSQDCKLLFLSLYCIIDFDLFKDEEKASQIAVEVKNSIINEIRRQVGHDEWSVVNTEMSNHRSRVIPMSLLMQSSINCTISIRGQSDKTQKIDITDVAHKILQELGPISRIQRSRENF
ncbi:MAG: hypothetical protein LLG04_04175 [Parachlamydia sp.]|nr:hypothetical protein [Parachlamydia sp.]